MKLKEFMKETMPLAKGSVKIPMQPIRDEYRKRYDKLVEEKSFKHDVYKVTPGGRVIVHVKVPSETVDNFYYDILLEVEETNKSSLEDCNVKFFSNCPSFVFTYAYLFYHMDPDGNIDPKDPKKGTSGALIQLLHKKIPNNRLLVPGSEDKLSDAVLDNAPDTRNPHRLIMLDKSIYFAIFYLLDNVPYADIVRTKNNRSESQVFVSVADFDGLMAKRKHAEAQQKRRRAADQRRAEAEVKKPTPKGRSVNLMRKVNVIGRTPSKSVNKVRAIKK